jgi:predicted aspartyl protease
MGRRAGSQILVSDDVDLTLIGVLTLEALGLKVDPTTGRLKETEILLL